MSNYTYHYFGAYLEIRVTKAKKETRFFGCKNGHRAYSRASNFCGECGEPVGEQVKIVEAYPTGIVYDLIGEQFEDILSVITPCDLNGKGVIIAIGNLIAPSCEWLHLGPWQEEGDPYTKEFPTSAEIAKMESEFSHSYNDIIVALKNSEHVERVTIKTGYVLNEEY